jgi:hypothetical protein
MLLTVMITLVILLAVAYLWEDICREVWALADVESIPLNHE